MRRRTTKRAKAASSRVNDGGGSRIGRPPTEVSDAQWAQIERMARAMCTQQEIADYLGINRRTFYSPHLKDRFERTTRMAAAATKLEVRERQRKLALEGKAPLNIIQWGNVHLGQAPASMRAERTPEGSQILEATAGAEERLIAILDKLAGRKAS